jgi:transcriptional regulator with XRE-family HTH domain
MYRGMTLSEYLTTTGTSASAFAAKLGVSQVTVHRYITEKRFPDKETILKIEKLTDDRVRPADWFSPKPTAASVDGQGAAA